MKEKILLTFLIFLTSFLAQGQITLTTTSSSGTWSPHLVTKSGADLTWEATNTIIGTLSPVSQNGSDPTFDFITNDGSPISIMVTSSDGFVGLTHLDFFGDPDRLEITDIDVSQATALESLIMRYNELSAIDISQNTELTSFNIRGNNQLLDQNLNTTANTKLETINLGGSGINNVDFSNNDLLVNVNLFGAHLTTLVLDKVIIDLDDNGKSGGVLDINSNKGQLSYNSFNAYNSLVGKGWTIDAPVPPSGPNTETITLTTTSNDSNWELGRLQNTGLILHWEAMGVGISTQIKDENKPSFDFSSNTNDDPITITITSEEGFDYLVEMSLYLISSSNGGYSDITDIDISSADLLKYLYPYKSKLTDIDVSQNTGLQRLLIHGNEKQLINQLGNHLDISNNSDLYQLRVNDTYIELISSLSNNPLIRDVDLSGSEFTSSTLDQVLIDLDANGITNPQDPQYVAHIQFLGNPGSLTSASYTAYNNLIAKGWTIDVPAPPAAPGADINITGLGASIPGNGTNVPSTTDDTDFGSVASGGIISKTFTIENLGDQPLDLTGNPDLVAITGTNAADFTISALPTTPIAVGGPNTTFEVTFNANSLGIRTATLTIESNDPDEASFVFNIQAESTQAIGHEINVTGNGQSIPNNNTPIIADDTDFGQVPIGSPVTHTFTIENLGNSDLTVKAIGLYESTPGSGTGDYAITNGGVPSGGFPPGGDVIVGAGSTITFDVKFDPQSLGAQTVFVGIESDDSDEQYYFVNLTAEGVGAGSSGTIDVQGGISPISITNGDSSPSVTDGTEFEQVVINDIKTNTFVINNTGTTDLTITNIDFVIGADTEFTLSNLPVPGTVISAGNNETFDVVFTPTAIGVYEAFVEIVNSDDTPFQYKVQGEGANVVVSGDIMITQYYSGFNATDKWIEVKNISGAPIVANTYYLALYNESAIPNIATIAPTASEQIPAMTTGEVLLFHKGAPAKPVSGSIGGATQISTAVCNFDGDDVILISTINDATCYSHREDIIGEIPVNPTNPWGADRSFIKGGCATEQPHANFDPNDWIRIKLGEVDGADSNTNLALGTQAFGATEFNGSVWLNLFPDRSRTAIITSSYNNANQSITACNLVVNTGVTVNFNSNGTGTNSIVLYGDLITNGTLIIGDTESLVTLGVSPTLGTITKIEKSNTLDNIHDNTYWASPVLGSSIGTVFTGVDVTRIFEYNAGNPNPIYPPTSEFRFWYNKPSGGMIIGKGYAAEGPAASVEANGDYLTPLDHEITFVGNPFTGILTLDLFYSGSDDTGEQNNNFNLIGNPYPTAIDIDMFFGDNQNVRDIALWTHATIINGGEYTKDDYVTYNRDGTTVPSGTVTNNIGSGQGFMARTTGETDIRFLDTHKMIGANDQFFKSSNTKKDSAKNEFEGDKIWLEMSDDTGYKSNIMIGFSAKATDGLDSKYDSYGYVMERDIKLYSNIDQEISKFVIQNLSSFSQDKKVSIGIDNNNSGNFKIGTVAKLGVLKDAEIYLVDNLLGITHNLKASDYTFKQTVTGSFPNRFTLQFSGQALDVDDDIFAKNEFIISNEFESLNIRSAKEVKDIKVYDLLGRVLVQDKPNKRSFNLNTGSIKNGTVLVIEATLENGYVVSKKTIKY